MTFQDQLGQRMSREIYAEEALENYQFIKYGTAEDKVKQATARATVIGLTLKSQLQTTDNGSGFQVGKEGWDTESFPEAIDKGVGYVKLGSGVSGATQGMYVMSDADGFAIPYAAPTFTLTDTGTAAELQAVFTTLLAQGKVIAGRLIDGGDAGDLVRIDLDDRRG